PCSLSTPRPGPPPRIACVDPSVPWRVSLCKKRARPWPDPAQFYSRKFSVAGSKAHRYHIALMPQILIVDDEPDSCEFVSRFLQMHGYQTRCVPNGRDALGLLLHNGFDAVVLDVRMPELDGISLLQILRSYL